MSLSSSKPINSMVGIERGPRTTTRCSNSLKRLQVSWHLAALYFGTHSNSNERSVSQLVTEIPAIVLPPVGAAATGLQSLLEGR